MHEYLRRKYRGNNCNRQGNQDKNLTYLVFLAFTGKVAKSVALVALVTATAAAAATTASTSAASIAATAAAANLALAGVMPRFVALVAHRAAHVGSSSDDVSCNTRRARLGPTNKNKSSEVRKPQSLEIAIWEEHLRLTHSKTRLISTAVSDEITEA